MLIYHQLGHQVSWNLQSFQRDHVGDGLILSPRHMKREEVERLPLQTRRASLFDPQWFLPDRTKGHLKTYDFVPKNMPGGYDTQDFGAKFARESAKLCVEFQIGNEFQAVIIPTRYKAGTPSNFVDRQSDNFVIPFLEEIKALGTDKEIYLQLVLNDTMLKDQAFTADILNWVTGISAIKGIYLVTEVANRRKQLEDVDFLLSLLLFIRALRDNDLEVILGYLNTEAFLLSIADPSAVTIGSFEKTRNFNHINFEEEERREFGPNPRLYITKLLQNVDYSYVAPISRLIKDDTFFDETPHKAEILHPDYVPHFSKSHMYKHYFAAFYRQLQNVGRLVGKQRYEYVYNGMTAAEVLFRTLAEKGVELDIDSSGVHLPKWKTAANLYAGELGWR